MNDEKQIEIRERLDKLPRRAIVAFAARCARRVQPLYAGSSPDETKHIRAIEDAILYAEAFASSREAKLLRNTNVAVAADDDAANAAVNAAVNAAKAANVAAANAANAAANAAAYAAVNAAKAATYVAADDAARSFIEAAFHDLARLEESELGRPGTLGKPVSVSERGRLGPLWPNGEPEWYTPKKAELDKRLGKKEDKTASPAKLREQEKTIGRLTAEVRQASERVERLASELETAGRVGATNERELEKTSEELKLAYSEITELTTKLVRIKKEKEQKSFAEVLRAFRDRVYSLEALLFLVSAITTICILFGSIVVMLNATSELIARQQVMSGMTAWTIEAKAEFVAINGVPHSNTQENDAKAGGKGSKREALGHRIKRAEALHQRARLLAASGANNPSQRLAVIRSDFERLIQDPDTTPALSEIAEKEGQNDYWPIRSLLATSHWKNDLLLSIAVVISGMIGAIVTSLRDKGLQTEVRELLLGVAAGFIALLAIRSGKSVFLVDFRDTAFVFNPYTSAAAGFLAGSFTSRAFELLLSGVKKFDANLRRVFDLEPARGTASESPTTTTEP